MTDSAGKIISAGMNVNVLYDGGFSLGIPVSERCGEPGYTDRFTGRFHPFAEAMANGILKEIRISG